MSPPAKSKSVVIVFTRAVERKCLGMGAANDAVALAASLRVTLEAVRAGCGDARIAVVSDRPLAVDSDHQLSQRGDSFEERLLAACDDVSALGYERLVVVGSDTPELSVKDVATALAGHDVVVGPAVDGGVYLFSVAADRRALLAGLPWCTPALLRALCTRAGEASLRVVKLALRRDLDNAADARALSTLLEKLCRHRLGEPVLAVRGTDEEEDGRVISFIAPTSSLATASVGPPR